LQPPQLLQTKLGDQVIQVALGLLSNLVVYMVCIRDGCYAIKWHLRACLVVALLRSMHSSSCPPLDRAL